jgi:hypothetical protein
MYRYTKFSLLAAIVVAFAGCSDPTGPPDPPVDTNPVENTVLVSDVGTSSITTVVDDVDSLRYVAYYSNGMEREFTDSLLTVWTSSNPSVASVTRGVMTSKMPGEAVITASHPGIPTATATVVVKAKPVTLTGIAIVGDSTVERVGKYQYGCRGDYSDDSQKMLANCAWSLERGEVHSYLVGDTLDFRMRGIVYLTATFGGFTATMSVRLTGTLMSKLPPISAAAWALVPKNYPSGEVFQLEMPFHLWADPRIPNQNLADAFSRWHEKSGGRIQFVSVPDSSGLGRERKIVFDSSIAQGICAWGGPAGISLNPVQEDGVYICANRVTLAHELGRLMGFPTVEWIKDIMSVPAVWEFSPEREEATVWTYSVPPGTIPVEG